MENDEVNLYWPVPIGSFFNKDHSNLKKGLLAFFENYIKENPSGRKSTENQDLYESNYDIHKLKNESFDKLIGFLCGSVGKTAHAANKGLIKNVLIL